MNTPAPDPTAAADATRAAAAGAPPAASDEPPLSPMRPRASSALIVLATLAVGYTLWAAQGVILPILLAMFFALIGNPIIRGLRRLYVPRALGAVLVLVGGLVGTVALGTQLVQPASEWARQVPRELKQLAPKLRQMSKPVHAANEAAANIARATEAGDGKPVQVVRTEANEPYKSLTATPLMITSLLAVVLLTFFFMVYGENLQRNALSLLPSRQQKRVTVEIMQSIETEISRYVLTISLINLLVGLALAGALVLLEVPLAEALLWGTMAAVLNFAPYVGPLIGIAIMLLMGFVAFDELWMSLLPAGIYLFLHTLEGQLITPIVLGRQMRLSPLVLILALMAFGSLWGIIGLLLAVPLLVCVKIVLSRIEGLEGWAKLLE
ncbi:transporter [Lysobacter concretionis Ko07 = DSM 16239]|jgi:predicted PurR-regulated permease PerM|uniref:Transporter n=2 Tax=Lysobacterales TaxID=135614 RepID=A0A0A0EUR8_9GAMM|nr:transporter [Lysobacter concretionis Ko07 = DSM 16239]QOD91308.1 AI-2E family transporter [Lysobacter sp. CW239]